MAIESLQYQGPERDYKAPVDNFAQIQSPYFTVAPTKGYADLDYLLEMLEIIKKECLSIYSRAEKTLALFSVPVDRADKILLEAHDIVYPDDKTPGYITFDEYKYLSNIGYTSAVQTVKNYYEIKLRGVAGTSDLDFARVANLIYDEAIRIGAFIEKYIGELDETAEYRAIEVFQDWAENTGPILAQISATVQTVSAAGLPQSELDSLTPELSSRSQALFQTKLNTHNKIISETLSDLKRSWADPADGFYNKSLGPSLLFHIKASKTLTEPNNYVLHQKNSVLKKELDGVVNGLAVNYSVALNDMIVRNRLFRSSCDTILANINGSDIYRAYIKQLSTKGTTINKTFVESSTVKQTEIVRKATNPLTTSASSYHQSNHVKSTHNDLLGRLDDDAHPQYLNISGGEIKGEITLAAGAKIDGIVPSQHRHNGKDGSSRIRGEDIVYGTLGDKAIEVEPTTVVPQNLRISKFDTSLMGKTKVELVFDVGELANIVNYEFEVVRLTEAGE